MPREWVIDEYHGFEGLRLADCQRENPGSSEVRLRVEAFALNWGDDDLMKDNYSFSFSSFPARIGIESAGIVEAVGADVKDVIIGKRYCTLPYFYDKRGASADTLIIDQKYITPAPEGLSAVEAASVWMQFMTAYFPIVELAKAAPGRNILVPAGTSTAGNAALKIGHKHGATMISTTRSEANRQLLIDSGADHVFVDKGGDIEGFIREATGETGIHASFDPVGADFMDRYANAMAKEGILLMYGTLTGEFGAPPILPMFQNNLWFHTYSVFNYIEDTAYCERGKTYVYEALSDQQLRPNIDRVFPMEGYIDAWRYLKGPRQNYGKVIVETGAKEG